MTRILDGKPVAASIRAAIADAVIRLSTASVVPRLVIVQATDDSGTDWYVRNLVRSGAKLGIDVHVERQDASATEAELSAAVAALRDEALDGIVIAAPLPAGIDAAELAEAIPPEIDVDGANPLSLGRIVAGLPAFAPTTARAVIELLDWYEVPLSGAQVAVVGRSLVVGRPLAELLISRDATTTVCHSRTKDLAAVTRRADIVVSAAGRPQLVTVDYVRSGAVVVDVGTTQDADGRLVGDVATDDVATVASAVSPVPGGVGAVTNALLLQNVTTAAQRRLPSSPGPAGG